jgi:predicted nucleotidyltransferase/predicted transcriptional regulator with HTH domain
MRMLDITRSKLRTNLLLYFFTNTQAKLHLRDIAERLSEDPGNLSRELNRLSHEGLFLVEEVGRQKFFSLNKEYGLFNEIKSIVLKTVGLPIQLSHIVEVDKNILLAFIYGSFASNETSIDSDVDVILIIKGLKFTEDRIQKEITSLERMLDREINWSYFPLKEWMCKIRQGESFVTNILSRPIIILKGDEQELRRLSSKRTA